jgi:8-oxo-dGTP pyrophosphatase MutT (NUDIX family)
VTTMALRRAASVLLVRGSPLEILMVKRHRRATFASSYVFPGGVVDADDGDDTWLEHLVGADELSVAERGNRVAACRETYEETAILLAMRRDGGAIDPSTVQPARPFRKLVAELDAVIDLTRLHPFAHWITPERMAKRYDTRFYIAAAPVGQVAVSDDAEVERPEWLRPADCVAGALSGDRMLYFPTLVNLELLSETDEVVVALAAAVGREAATITPEVETRADGKFVTIPAGVGYRRVEFPLQSQ